MNQHRSSIKVFTGNANPELAAGIARHMRIPLGKANVSTFSDGEICCEIQESVRGHDVFIIQPLSRPVNNHLMELLIMIDAAKRASAERITAVVPYYGLRAPGSQGASARSDHGQAGGGFDHHRGRDPAAHHGFARGRRCRGISTSPVDHILGAADFWRRHYLERRFDGKTWWSFRPIWAAFRARASLPIA